MKGLLQMLGRRRATDAVLGVYLDPQVGTATGVVVHEGKVTKTLVGVGATLPARVADVYTNAGPVEGSRIGLDCPSMITRAVLAGPSWVHRHHFTAAAHEATQTQEQGHVVVGSFDRAALTEGVQGAAVVALPAPVAELVDDLCPSAAQVVPVQLCLRPTSGAVLHVGESTVTLTLVEDGRILASAQLPAGGTHPLDVALGHGQNVGASRLAAALRARPADHYRVDHVATAELDAYARLVASQVAATLGQWRTRNLPFTTGVLTCLGAAATSAVTRQALADLGIATEQSSLVESALASVQPADRGQFAIAYLAARTWDPHRPQEALVRPKAVHEAAQILAAGQRKTVKTTAAGVATILAMGLATPAVLASAAYLDAQRHLDAQVTAVAHASHTSTEQVRALLQSGQLGTTTDPTVLARARTAGGDAGTLSTAELTARGATLKYALTGAPSAIIERLEASGLSVTSSRADTGTLTVALANTGGAR